MSYMLPFWCVLVLFGNAFSTEKEKTRRILVNDPNYVIQQELSAIKTSLQEHQSKILQLENDKTSQANTIVQQTNAITQLQTDISRYRSFENGAVYTRWGRKECPDNETELVYSGIVGGSHYTQLTGAAEYICLPTDPTWSKYDDSLQDYRDRMYGAEYEEDFFKSGLTNDDVPCAVCRRHSASSMILLPGRNQCYTGWRTEYFGYLASGGAYPDQKAASQFVCLDENPEVVFHSSRDENGKLFYMVEGICGSLSCPPYVNGRELTCSVCTK